MNHTDALKKTAESLFAAGTIDGLIAFRKLPKGASIAAFFTKAEDLPKIVFDDDTQTNLATYLIRPQIKRRPKTGIVVKGCDLKAVHGLIQENQTKRENLHLIGITCEGMKGTDGKPYAKCASCKDRVPKGVDTLVGAAPDAPAQANPTDAEIAKFDAMTSDQRWEYWLGQMDKCIRCYACRNACPLCSCDRCVMDKNQPQWVETSAHPRGNLAFHLTRAFHLAGRCVGCEACQTSCPQGIPLMLLNRKMALEIERRFGYIAGYAETPDDKPPFAMWRPDDPQEFIR